ncbi:hypothetical protein [Herbiconiux liukaitaii]|uniref:hypothetical protein n=1 Tax=Herbiconiux liukaitaii TaxID=3342799 RepID=UPI0035B8F6A5
MTRCLRLLCTSALALLVLPLALLVGAPPAVAATALAHGQGVLWAVDRTSWLGNYVLDDGLHGYCIDVEKPPPLGSAVDYLPGREAAWFGLDDSARLAFISREWGDPADPLTAAAAQLATWTVTGLAGHDQAYFARRANADADLVLTAANHMLRIADGTAGASRGVTATVQLDLEGHGGRVTSDLVVDYLGGARSPAPRSFSATVTLRGAVFADGSRTASVPNGVSLPIKPDQAGATEKVAVDVVYRNLPFGADYRLGRSAGDTQSLLVSNPYPAEARASASATAPNELPFAPRVVTTTSEAIAAPGTELSDIVTLSAHPESATGAEWGRYRARDGSLEPIPVVIESVLWGPFGAPPALTDRAPSGAPQVCTVELLVEGGPGTYRTPACTIDAPGFYVWTDSIDPARTPGWQGGDRLRPWNSPFGVTSETTVVPASPRITTTASHHRLTAPACVSDTLTVTGLPEGTAPLAVTSTLLGPLEHRPPSGATPPGWEEFPVAGEVVTAIDRDGEHESPCIGVFEPGFYYFVFSSPGTSRSPASPSAAASALTSALVPPFSDTRVHDAESLEFVAPAPTPPPTAPPAGPPTPPATPPAVVPPPAPPITEPPATAPPSTPATPQAQLPRTGSMPPALSTALAVAAVLAALAGLGFALRHRS